MTYAKYRRVGSQYAVKRKVTRFVKDLNGKFVDGGEVLSSEDISIIVDTIHKLENAGSVLEADISQLEDFE